MSHLGSALTFGPNLKREGKLSTCNLLRAFNIIEGECFLVAVPKKWDMIACILQPRIVLNCGGVQIWHLAVDRHHTSYNNAKILRNMRSPTFESRTESFGESWKFLGLVSENSKLGTVANITAHVT
jgi:hypothetical protein